MQCPHSEQDREFIQPFGTKTYIYRCMRCGHTWKMNEEAPVVMLPDHPTG
jgi:hypothetical protein